ncbi:MAG: PorT family protein [Cytophagaceae bacterium]|jgi:hypothetical protein|nr:PorT family protein [Cytophagaceae bacterium]
MLKNLFTFIISCSLHYISIAQINTGVRLGSNFMQIKNENSNASVIELNTEAAVGLQAGFLLDIKLNDYLRIRPEIVYNLYRSKTPTLDFFGVSTIGKFSYHYISIPLNMVGTIPLGSSSLQLFFGPQLSAALGATTTVETTILGNTTVDKQQSIPGKEDDISDDDTYVNPIMTGMNIGAAYQYKRVLINLSYFHGLSNLTAFYTDDTLNDSRKNSSFTFNGVNLGIAYLFGGK